MKTEMEKLIEMLEKAHIPHEVSKYFGTLQICYPSRKKCICDAFCHFLSDGHEQGLLEIMGLVDEEEFENKVEGWLTANEVFERISKHYAGIEENGQGE